MTLSAATLDEGLVVSRLSAEKGGKLYHVALKLEPDCLLLCID